MVVDSMFSTDKSLQIMSRFKESPDSIPSLAESSEASLQGEERVYHPSPLCSNVSPRRLFLNEHGSEAAFEMHTINHLKCVRADEYSKEMVSGDVEAFSTTSSETTEITARNLSKRDLEDDHGNFPKLLSSKGSVFGSPRKTCQVSPLMVEEPPEEPSPTCTSALSLTPRQLTELFVAFQGRKKTNKPKDNLDMDLPTPQEELERRECDELKRIMQIDSGRIVALRRELERQRDLKTLKDVELEDKEIELQIASERIDSLKKEKELMREREEEMIQTIRILKIEVDKLSTWGNNKCRLTPGQEFDLEDVDTEPGSVMEVFPVVDENAELLAQLEAKERENVQLRAQIDYYQNMLLCPEERKDNLAINDESVSSTDEIAALSLALQDITTRLDAVELKKQLRREARSVAATDRKCHDARDSIDDAYIAKDPDAIEISIPTGSTNNSIQSPSRPLSCCCEIWHISE